MTSRAFNSFAEAAMSAASTDELEDDSDSHDDNDIAPVVHVLGMQIVLLVLDDSNDYSTFDDAMEMSVDHAIIVAFCYSFFAISLDLE